MPYTVMIHTTHMPNSVLSGDYRKIALVEVDDLESLPKMISERARGMRTILELYDRVHVGRTMRSWGRRLIAELRERADDLNQGVAIRLNETDTEVYGDRGIATARGEMIEPVAD